MSFLRGDSGDTWLGQSQWYQFGAGEPPILVYFSGPWNHSAGFRRSGGGGGVSLQRAAAQGPRRPSGARRVGGRGDQQSNSGDMFFFFAGSPFRVNYQMMSALLPWPLGVWGNDQIWFEGTPPHSNYLGPVK